MKKFQFESDYSPETVNSVQISPGLFCEAFNELVNKFGVPLRSETKEASLSAILYTEGWAKHLFENETNAKLIGIAVYSRYTAYIDAVSDLFINKKYDLAKGRFNWFDCAFIAAAATTRMDSIEMDGKEPSYHGYFRLPDFVRSVREFAHFYQYVESLSPCGFESAKS